MGVSDDDDDDKDYEYQYSEGEEEEEELAEDTEKQAKEPPQVKEDYDKELQMMGLIEVSNNPVFLNDYRCLCAADLSIACDDGTIAA